LRAFLAEFGSLDAASKYLDEQDKSNSRVSKVALISPAAQEYLQPASPARDPDTMVPSFDAKVGFPGWKLLFRSSRQSAGIKAEELPSPVEKSLQKRLKTFRGAVLERHRNAMVIHVRLIAAHIETILASADSIATDHNFICAAIANDRSAILAFLPLSVDPPAAMHYAEVISKLAKRLDASIRLRILACPSEAWRYLPPQPSNAISLLFRAIKRGLRWTHDITR